MISLQGEDTLSVFPQPYSRITSRINDHDEQFVQKSWYIRLGSSLALFWNELKAYRFLRIPKLNWFIILFFAGFLIRLMFLFTSLYAYRALLTMIISNILLYGLADTLAQTLPSMMEFKPDLSANTFHIRFVIEKALPSGGFTLNDGDSDDEDEGLLELGLADDDFNFEEPTNRPNLRRRASRASSISSSGLALHDQNEYNFRRLSLFMVWGVVQAFLQYGWYAILNDVYSEDNLFLSALKRVLSDQLCYSPFSLAGFFIYTTIVIDRGDGDAVKAKLRSKYLPTLVVNYAVWPLAQFINFLLLPRALQVPFASTDKGFYWAYFGMHTFH